MHKHVWRDAKRQLIPCSILAIIGATIGSTYGSVSAGDIEKRLIAILGVIVFIAFSTISLHILTNVVYRLIANHHLGAGRAAATRLILRIFGYTTIAIAALDLLHIPIAQLLLGGAALGIILGVAAQQALANFFASIVLLIVHPYTIGDHIIIRSGGLGGEYIGTVKDIGLTHTQLMGEDEKIIFLPNATLLSASTIIQQPK